MLLYFQYKTLSEHAVEFYNPSKKMHDSLNLALILESFRPF